MLTISKTRREPGLDVVESAVPTLRPGHVKIAVHRGSICGTDLHLDRWDAFAQKRLHPSRIIGHEFCGEIIEVGEGVDPGRMGQFISSESHVVCGECRQCLAGDRHVCANTQILGIDIDGGFGGYAVIPAENAHLSPAKVSREVASMLDAVGNAVHTVMDACPSRSLKGQRVLITGLGPIGLFAAAICRILEADTIVGTEIRPLRKKLGLELGVDQVIDPTEGDADEKLRKSLGSGADLCLEMSGHPSGLRMTLEHCRAGGAVSLLGLYGDPEQSIPMNDVVMKGLRMHGIVGRRLPETWDDMTWLFDEMGLNVDAVVTHQVGFHQAREAFDLLERGDAGKVVIDFSGAR